MRTRTAIGAVALAGVLAAACSDVFSVEDALGLWEVEEINGSAVPGTVWIRGSSGDSAQVTLEDFYWEFLDAPECSYTIDVPDGPPFTNDACVYAVGEDGDLSITLGGEFSLTGVADGNGMALQDEDGNVFVLHRASTPAPVVSVEVTPAADTVRAGGTLQLTGTPLDADGDPVARRAVTWESDDEAVATVDDSGLVTGTGSGTATITATSGGRDGTAEVTVWVGVTGAWVGSLDVPGGPCQLDLSITEAGAGAITGTSLLYAPCLASPFAVTGTNNAAGVTDSVTLGFDNGGGATFSFAGRFDSDATMTGSVFPGPHPATITRQSLSPAPPAEAAVRSDVRSGAAAPLWPRRDPGGQ
jgi:hypothetical protein